jgi:hypothetical protein
LHSWSNCSTRNGRSFHAETLVLLVQAVALIQAGVSTQSRESSRMVLSGLVKMISLPLLQRTARNKSQVEAGFLVAVLARGMGTRG